MTVYIIEIVADNWWEIRCKLLHITIKKHCITNKY